MGLRQIRAQLCYHMHVTHERFAQLDEHEIVEIWEELIWIREQEAKANGNAPKSNTRKKKKK